MKATYKKLLVSYYATMAMVLIVLCIFAYMHKQGLLVDMLIDPQTTAGQIFQYVTIGYTLLVVAGGLYFFKLLCQRLAKMEDEEKRLYQYCQWGTVRILLMGVGILLGILAFFLLQGYQSMIWCAAIAAIGLIFCKPNERKIEIDLSNEEQ